MITDTFDGDMGTDGQIDPYRGGRRRSRGEGSHGPSPPTVLVFTPKHGSSGTKAVGLVGAGPVAEYTARLAIKTSDMNYRMCEE